MSLKQQYDWELNAVLCRLFDCQRWYLLTGASEILRPYVQINNFSNDVLVELLLYGDEKLSDNDNNKLLKLTQDFIHKTGRFENIKRVIVQHAATKSNSLSFLYRCLTINHYN